MPCLKNYKIWLHSFEGNHSCLTSLSSPVINLFRWSQIKCQDSKKPKAVLEDFILVIWILTGETGYQGTILCNLYQTCFFVNSGNTTNQKLSKNWWCISNRQGFYKDKEQSRIGYEMFVKRQATRIFWVKLGQKGMM